MNNANDRFLSSVPRIPNPDASQLPRILIDRERTAWPHQLAEALRDNPSLRLGQWADSKGLDRSSVSRRFRQVFSVSPKAFHLRCKAQRAIDAVQRSGGRLCDIATECGFADQAHMTRCVRRVTGITPGNWRSKETNTLMERAGWSGVKVSVTRRSTDAL